MGTKALPRPWRSGGSTTVWTGCSLALGNKWALFFPTRLLSLEGFNEARYNGTNDGVYQEEALRYLLRRGVGSYVSKR